MIARTIFSSGHDAFRDSVRRFITGQVMPHHADWEKARRVPRDMWFKAAKPGFLCCNVPEEYGGTAEVMKQIIGNALLPKVRKAN